MIGKINLSLNVSQMLRLVYTGAAVFSLDANILSTLFLHNIYIIYGREIIRFS